MKISFVLDNIIFSLQKAGGISVYWTEILKRIVRDYEDLKCIEYINADTNIFRNQLDLPLRLIDSRISLPLQLQRYLPVINNLTSFDIFHSSYYRFPIFKKNRSIVTVYDFTYEKYKSGLTRYIHSLQKKIALMQSDGVICISNSTKKDLIEFMPGYPQERICVTHLGFSSEFHTEKNDVILNEYPSFPKPYLVFVGERKGYKNFFLVLEAMRHLPHYHLVIVGGGALDEERDLVQSSCVAGYTHLQAIPSSALNSIYQDAHALIYPSDYEGFGIPILEAMASGCPVIANRSSSIPEVAGKAGLLYENINFRNIIEAVTLLENSHFRKVQIELGLENKNNFSWEKCYQETISFYRYIKNLPKK